MSDFRRKDGPHSSRAVQRDLRTPRTVSSRTGEGRAASLGTRRVFNTKTPRSHRSDDRASRRSTRATSRPARSPEFYYFVHFIHLDFSLFRFYSIEIGKLFFTKSDAPEPRGGVEPIPVVVVACSIQ